MYNYDELSVKFNINKSNKFHLKAIIKALENNGEAHIEKQKIYVNFNKLEYLWSLYLKLKNYFDYRYNTKIDLTKIFYYILNKKVINFNAIFCPGYTDFGYKNYIGNNNTQRLIILKSLKDLLQIEKLKIDFKIYLADIFLENTDYQKNPNWEIELNIHIEKFINKASEYFDEDEIILFSKIFSKENYIKGFINPNILMGKTYEKFYKNNVSFYQKMNWSLDETKERNDRLYTIYTIISKYISNQQNGIYLPMETMYSRSKVMTSNDVCTMYLKK